MYGQVQTLTQENLQLKARVADLERLIDPKILDELDANRSNVSQDLKVHNFFFFGGGSW